MKNLIISLLIFSLFFCLYGGTGTSGGSKVKANPAFGQWPLELESEYIIINTDSASKAMLSYVRDFKMDSKGNFFLLDLKQHGVLIFNSKGTFRQRLGLIGRGPGDFQIPWKIFIDYQDHIHISDRQNHNVTELSPDGKVRHITPVSPPINSDFFVSPQGDIFGFVRDIEQNGVVRRLVEFNHKGERSETIAGFHDASIGFKRSRGGGGVMGGRIHKYTPDAYLYPMDKNTFCYGFNLDNKIYIYHIGDKKSKVVPLPGEKEPITDDEKEYFERTCGKRVQLPGHRPFFKKILCDEKGRIYLFRVNPILSDEKSQTIDVFNKEGIYIYHLQSSEDPILIRHGYFYTLAEDESKDVIVKRFRIKNYKSMQF
jgi:hypothetical protein